jgi:hypothetical protein
MEDVARETITARGIDEHLAFLVSDRARGRNGPQSGANRVAAWVANHFQIAGLVPAGHDGGFVQYRVRVNEHGDTTHAPNVIAVAPGRDGKLADQFILVVARFGYGGEWDEDSAPASVGSRGSGDPVAEPAYPSDAPRTAVAALVEIARAVAALQAQIRRPVAFMAINDPGGAARDSGWFIDQSVAGLDRAVAVIEIGGVGNADAQSLLVDGYERSSIGPLLTHIAGNTPSLKLRVMAFAPSEGLGTSSAVARGGPSWRDIPAVGLSTVASEAHGDARGSNPSFDPDVDVDVAARAARLIFLTVHHLAVEHVPPATTRPRSPAVGGR